MFIIGSINIKIRCKEMSFETFIVIVCFLGLQWIFCLRVTKILKMIGGRRVFETNQELSLFCPSDIVFCDPGDDVVLSCHLEPAISAVSMEIKWWNKTDLVFHYKDGWIIQSCGSRVSLSLQDLHNGNVSLTLRDVRRSQRGLYICEVTHKYQIIKEYIFLHINSEDLSFVVSTGPVSADPGSDVILPVRLLPETSAVSMKIRWFKGTELIYQYKNGWERINNNYENRVSLLVQELERGNLSLILRNVQPSDSGNYTCQFFHGGCQRTGTVHLQVRELLKCRYTWYRHMPDSMAETQAEKIPIYDITDGPASRRRNGMEGNRLLSDMLLRQLIELQRRTLERLRFFIPTTTGILHGPTPRRRNNVEGIRLLMETASSSLHITASAILSATARAQAQENSGTTMQMTQERSRQSIVTERGRSSTAVQSCVLEREQTSQSVTAPNRNTQPPRRPQDRARQSKDGPKKTKK